MKNTFFLLALVIMAANTITAQFRKDPILNIQNEDKKLINFGYYLGFNEYDFQFEYNNNITGRNGLTDMLVEKSFGFNVGVLGELRLNEYLDLRFEPGLLYTSRNLQFPSLELEGANEILREVRSTYIRFPLLLKVSTKRFNNFKPFIIGGVYSSLNLGAKEDSLADNLSGEFRMVKNVYGYELGFGVDFYTEYFKFTPSIRGVFALTDELVRDDDPNSPWTGNIEAMRTRGIFINLTFE